MKILSIDVGMKNLAYCLLDYTNNNYKIDKWDIIDLCNEQIYICKGINKKNIKCNKIAKFKKYNECYCKIHAKNKKFKIPNNNLKTKKIKKLRIAELKKLAYDYDISLNALSKKKECYNQIILDISNNYFDYIEKTKTNDFTLVQYGISMKKEFEKIFNTIGYNIIDIVLIENQIGPLALRMKTLQGMIMQHFIEKNIPIIKEISASNKLKEFLGKQKTTYNERKKKSIEITRNLLIDNNNINCWLEYFNKHKKKDDLADCFLQVKWHINQ